MGTRRGIEPRQSHIFFFAQVDVEISTFAVQLEVIENSIPPPETQPLWLCLSLPLNVPSNGAPKPVLPRPTT
jgi:hypothetical protein